MYLAREVPGHPAKANTNAVKGTCHWRLPYSTELHEEVLRRLCNCMQGRSDVDCHGDIPLQVLLCMGSV